MSEKPDLTAPDMDAEKWNKNDTAREDRRDYHAAATAKRFWDHRRSEAARVWAAANARFWANK